MQVGGIQNLLFNLARDLSKIAAPILVASLGQIN